MLVILAQQNRIVTQTTLFFKLYSVRMVVGEKYLVIFTLCCRNFFLTTTIAHGSLTLQCIYAGHKKQVALWMLPSLLTCVCSQCSGIKTLVDWNWLLELLLLSCIINLTQISIQNVGPDGTHSVEQIPTSLGLLFKYKVVVFLNH